MEGTQEKVKIRRPVGRRKNTFLVGFDLLRNFIDGMVGLQ